MERGVRQVNSLTYKLPKAQQLPKTSTYKPTNPQTHEHTRSLTQKIILYARWKDYPQNKDLYLTDATCYESHLRFHTDVKLLCECCQWFHD